MFTQTGLHQFCIFCRPGASLREQEGLERTFDCWCTKLRHSRCVKEMNCKRTRCAKKPERHIFHQYSCIKLCTMLHLCLGAGVFADCHSCRQCEVCAGRTSVAYEAVASGGPQGVRHYLPVYVRRRGIVASLILPTPCHVTPFLLECPIYRVAWRGELLGADQNWISSFCYRVFSEWKDFFGRISTTEKIEVCLLGILDYGNEH